MDSKLSLFALGCAFGCTPTITKVTLSAYRALKIAQRRLRPEVRAKLMGVISARTDSTLTPRAWRFLFHDATTNDQCRIVTVAAQASSEHPDTVGAFSGTQMDPHKFSHPVTQNKLIIDTEEILAKARAAATLDEIQAAEYSLAQGKTQVEPLWELRFFTNLEEPVATVLVKAKSGEVTAVKKPS